MRRTLTAIALAAAGTAQAGALVECYAEAQQRPQVTACLQQAQKAAADTLRERLLAVRAELTRLAAATGRDAALQRLSESQRDFERYLRSQCALVVASFDAGTGAGQAGLACEVDLLRARAVALAALLPKAQ
jgi:hypothetical protein